MRPLLSVIAICSLLTTTAHAGPKELTVFQDGILIEIETTARKGIAEIQLPAAIREGSLRVKPLEAYPIRKVDLVESQVPDKLRKELDTLTEQKNRLEDRMKALETKETIFAAAAKSQSSKAPRKTKANPDPLASVRQGTEFAIAQLEAVFTARRRTEQELKRITARLNQLEKKSVAGPVVRVTGMGRLRVAAVLRDGGWIPRYELHLNGSSSARLVMHAETGDLPDGFNASVAKGSLSSSPSHTQPSRLTSGQPVATWDLPIEQQQINNGPLPSFSITIANTSGYILAAGSMAVYHHGEFLGSIPFGGSSTGAPIKIVK